MSLEHPTANPEAEKPKSSPPPPEKRDRAVSSFGFGLWVAVHAVASRRPVDDFPVDSE
jgi:hypothetical protein